MKDFMNNRVKAGLVFGIIMSLFYIAFSLLTCPPESNTLGLLKVVFSGIIGGVIAGLFFGWGIGLFLNSRSVKNSIKIETDPGEQIIFQTPANHFKGIEATGGKLYLTNKRLVFKSHHLNIQIHQFQINLNDIVEVAKYNPLGIINNGLMIKTNQSNTEKFVVDKPEDWVKYLDK